MQRRLPRRTGRVHQAARKVDGAARAEFELVADVAGRRAGFEALAPERQSHRGVVDRPALRAAHLQHEHVVGVPVRGEPLRVGRREVRVGLDPRREAPPERGAQPRQRRHAPVELVEDDGRAGVEVPRDVERPDPAGVVRVLAGGDLAVTPDQADVATPGRVRAQHGVEVGHREEPGVVGGRRAPDVQQPPLVVVAFELRGRQRIDEPGVPVAIGRRFRPIVGRLRAVGAAAGVPVAADRRFRPGVVGHPVSTPCDAADRPAFPCGRARGRGPA